MILEINVGQLTSNEKLLESGTLPPTKEFIATISAMGVIQNIVVSKVNASSYTVIAGRRRLIAARSLGLKSVPCKIVKGKRIDKWLITIAENNQRKSNPLSDFVALGKICLDHFGLDLDEIDHEQTKELAKLSSLPIQTVKRIMTLGSLPAVLFDALMNGELNFAMCCEISKQPENIQKACIEAYERDGDLSRADFRELRRTIKNSSAGSILDEIDSTSEANEAAKADYKSGWSSFESGEQLSPDASPEFVEGWVSGFRNR